MLTDLNKSSLNFKKFSGFDVAIIGAGAAGITLAKKLSYYGKKVALIEAGGKEYDEESQKIYSAKKVGDPYFELDTARLRYFGGSTNHWGGMCRTFETEDFNREYLGEKYIWPISYNELDRFRVEACNILEISSYFNDKSLENSSIESIDFKFSSPVRFGRKYFNDLASNSLVHIFLNSNLVDVTNVDSKITAVNVKSYNKTQASIHANNFVFSMGGIENSRYLLWLQKVYGNKFISSSSPIGRYWMEHPHFTLGKALIKTSSRATSYYALSQEAQVNNRIMNCGLRVKHMTHKDTEILIKNLLCNAPKFVEKIISQMNENLICGVTIRAAWEQAPDKRNFIQLDNEKDQFGIPKPILNWKKFKLDRETLVKSLSEFNNWLLESDTGRLQLMDWILNEKDYPLDDELAGHHHMGGTRMHKNKELGVVDSNCKVHGSKNLYIAGSSIFTTSGHNNPTLPIVQFSLRLAEHLSL